MTATDTKADAAQAFKVTADRAALAHAATWVARAIASRPRVAELTGILVHVDKDRVTLTASDFDLTLRAEVQAVATDETTALVPGRNLTGYLNALGAGEVNLEFGPTALTIRQRRSSSRLGLMPGEWPVPTYQPNEKSGTLEAPQLGNLIRQLEHALGEPTDGIAWSSGFGIEPTDGGLTWRSGSRYQQAQITIDTDYQGLPVVVPGRLASTAIPGLVGEVAVYSDESAVVLATEAQSATIRTYAEQWPKTAALFQGTTGQGRGEVTFDREPLIDALKRLSLSGGGVTMRAWGGLATLTSRRLDEEEVAGSGTEEIDCTGDDLVIGFDTARLLGILESLTGEVVTLQGSKLKAAPTLFWSDAPADGQRVLMPLKPEREDRS